MKYQFIDQQKQAFPVVVMCRVLDVSESGFYAWRKRSTCQRQREDAQLSTQIRQIFTAHQGRYGSPRLHAELRDQGQNISRKRVARLMREAGLCAKGKRHRVITMRRDASHPVASNLLDRDFTATEPNKNGATPREFWPEELSGCPSSMVRLTLVLKAATGKELADAIKKAHSHRGGPVLIECQIAHADLESSTSEVGNKGRSGE
jgi:Transposase and inactivated derivatives